MGLPPKTPHGFHIHEFGDTFTKGKILTFRREINPEFLLVFVYKLIVRLQLDTDFILLTQISLDFIPYGERGKSFPFEEEPLHSCARYFTAHARTTAHTSTSRHRDSMLCSRATVSVA